jgi:hypothetical protein
MCPRTAGWEIANNKLKSRSPPKAALQLIVGPSDPRCAALENKRKASKGLETSDRCVCELATWELVDQLTLTGTAYEFTT